ncbi:MAG: hypothetical protein Ct9H300mP26_4890 [Acidimicrobiales bacterium]|nr:MAG: hypothetical protein Ct9H300mP26_4890 [Acidimicrobiales bacterium]
MINLAFLPLFHTGGLNVFANPTFHFGEQTCDENLRPKPSTSPSQRPRNRCHSHHRGARKIWVFMSQVPEFASASFPNLLAPAVGGSPTPVPLIEAFGEKKGYLFSKPTE